MGLNYEKIIDRNEGLFQSFIEEKLRLIKKINSTKYVVITVFFLYTAFRIFPEFLENYSFYKSVLISGIIVIAFSSIIIFTKNELFLSHRNLEKLNARFKNIFVLSLVKSISDELVFKPGIGISANIVRESGLFPQNFTDKKGSNLIKGDFNGCRLQLSEIVLIKGGSKKFQGILCYVNGIGEDQLIAKDINQLSTTWRHRGQELYIAIPKKRRQFHMSLTESGKSITNMKSDLAELIQFFLLISKMTGIRLESSYIAPDMEAGSFDDLFNKKSTYLNPSSKQELILADSTKRIFNFFIDQAIILIISSLVIFIFQISNLALSLVIVLGIFTGYYILMETLLSQTIGKMITKSKVAMRDGTKPGFLTICLRTVFRFIPFEQYSFINTNVGFHDKFSKTIVIEQDKMPLQRI